MKSLWKYGSIAVRNCFMWPMSQSETNWDKADLFSAAEKPKNCKSQLRIAACAESSSLPRFEEGGGDGSPVGLSR